MGKLDPGHIERRMLRPDALAVSPVYSFVYTVTLPGHFEVIGGRSVRVAGGVHHMQTVVPELAVQACQAAGVIPSRTPEAWS